MSKRLTHAEAIKIGIWVDSKREFFSKQRNILKEHVNACRQATSVDVSTRSLREICKNIGIVFAQSKAEVVSNDKIIKALLEYMKLKVVTNEDGSTTIKDV